MNFQDDPGLIHWRLHLKSPPHVVYHALSADEGWAKFWAESAMEVDGAIDFVFPNGQRWRGKIIERNQPARFVMEY